MINVATFIDYSNLMGQMRSVGRRPDLLTLKAELANPESGRFPMDVTMFAPLPHENGAGVHRFHDSLRHQGIQVKTKRTKRLPDGNYKCDLDIEMALGALGVIDMVHPPEAVILVTGDGDFAPLSLKLREKGFFVEVASLPNGIAGELKASAQGFIDLTEWANTCPKLHANAPELGGNDIFDEDLL